MYRVSPLVSLSDRPPPTPAICWALPLYYTPGLSNSSLCLPFLPVEFHSPIVKSRLQLRDSCRQEKNKGSRKLTSSLAGLAVVSSPAPTEETRSAINAHIGVDKFFSNHTFVPTPERTRHTAHSNGARSQPAIPVSPEADIVSP